MSGRDGLTQEPPAPLYWSSHQCMKGLCLCAFTWGVCQSMWTPSVRAPWPKFWSFHVTYSSGSWTPWLKEGQSCWWLDSTGGWEGQKGLEDRTVLWGAAGNGPSEPSISEVFNYHILETLKQAPGETGVLSDWDVADLDCLWGCLELWL